MNLKYFKLIIMRLITIVIFINRIRKYIAIDECYLITYIINLDIILMILFHIVQNDNHNSNFISKS